MELNILQLQFQFLFSLSAISLFLYCVFQPRPPEVLSVHHWALVSLEILSHLSTDTEALDGGGGEEGGTRH